IESVKKWDKIKEELVLSMFQHEDCFLVTAHPQEWSLSHDYPDKLRLKINKVTYEIVHVRLDSRVIVEGIVECPDFDLGNLWIVLDRESRPDFEELIREEQVRGMRAPVTRETVLMCERDGDIMYLINPPLPIEQLYEVLNRIAGSVGWSFQGP